MKDHANKQLTQEIRKQYSLKSKKWNVLKVKNISTYLEIANVRPTHHISTALGNLNAGEAQQLDHFSNQTNLDI